MDIFKKETLQVRVIIITFKAPLNKNAIKIMKNHYFLFLSAIKNPTVPLT
jgi:hypothetical protein